jgi:hypothetical protein
MTFQLIEDHNFFIGLNSVFDLIIKFEKATHS